MSEVIHIAPNMWFSRDEKFGVFDVYIIFDILCDVDLTLSTALQLLPFSSRPCLISYNDFKDCPMCCDDMHGGHRILLNTKGNYWSQWIYQFAHEYCHHLIDGRLIGGIWGMMWFEETICELSSMYNLHCAAESWEHSTNPSKAHFAQAHRDYLNDLLRRGEIYESAPFPHRGFQPFLDNLSIAREYRRDLYRCFATMLFPLFLSNPRLWKIILHFGDMRGWNSLEELFGHLECTSSDDYRDSLLQMENLLFS